MKNYNNFKAEMLKDQEIAEEYSKLQPKLAVAKAIIEARVKNNMTQAQLAEKTSIDQGDISKLENGKKNPTVDMLGKVANGLNSTLKIEFIPNN